MKIFEDERVDLNRVYIGHSDDTTDLNYLMGLLKKGVWVGLDRFPGGWPRRPLNWEVRTETTKKLIDAGFGNRIMLSHDWAVSTNIMSRQEHENRVRLNPDGYLFITRKILPRLKELGVKEEAINDIMVNNPRRFFEGS